MVLKTYPLKVWTSKFPAVCLVDSVEKLSTASVEIATGHVMHGQLRHLLQGIHFLLEFSG